MISQTDFSAGIISDRDDVPNSCSWLTNMRPGPGGSLTRRGGKEEEKTWTSENNSSLYGLPTDGECVYPTISGVSALGWNGVCDLLLDGSTSQDAVYLANIDSAGDIGTVSNVYQLDSQTNSAYWDGTSAAMSVICGYNVVALGQEIVFASRQTAPMVKWGGSLKANYTTGTVAVTADSTTVTGTGTTWSGNVEAGMYLQITTGDAVESHYFKIASVGGNTSLTLEVPPQASHSGKSYVITKTGCVSKYSEDGTSSVFPGCVGASAPIIEAHNGRLFAARPYQTNAHDVHRVVWSHTDNEAANDAELSGRVGMDVWQSEAYVDIYPGVGGEITGMHSVDKELIILKENAVFSLRGDVASDGTDLGARVDIISRNGGAEGFKASCTIPGGVAWMNRNGLYVYRNGQVTDITAGKVNTAWREMYYDNQYKVLTCDGRRILAETSDVNNSFLEFDIPSGAFFFQTTDAPCTSGLVKAYDGSGGAIGHLMAHYTSSGGTINVYNWDFDLITFKGHAAGTFNGEDPQSDGGSDDIHFYSRFFDLGEKSLQGRPQNIYLEYQLGDDDAADPSAFLYARTGRRYHAHVHDVATFAQATDYKVDENEGSVTTSEIGQLSRFPIKNSRFTKSMTVDIEGLPALCSSFYLTAIHLEYTPVNRGD